MSAPTPIENKRESWQRRIREGAVAPGVAIKHWVREEVAKQMSEANKRMQAELHATIHAAVEAKVSSYCSTVFSVNEEDEDHFQVLDVKAEK